MDHCVHHCCVHHRARTTVRDGACVPIGPLHGRVEHRTGPGRARWSEDGSNRTEPESNGLAESNGREPGHVVLPGRGGTRNSRLARAAPSEVPLLLRSVPWAGRHGQGRPLPPPGSGAAPTAPRFNDYVPRTTGMTLHPAQHPTGHCPSSSSSRPQIPVACSTFRPT